MRRLARVPGILAETFPNRIYQHAAQTDRLSNTFNPTSLPTIWDRLAGSALTGRYYFSDLPFLALWGSKYVPISHPIREFYDDAAAGRLPDVSFVDESSPRRRPGSATTIIPTRTCATARPSSIRSTRPWCAPCSRSRQKSAAVCAASRIGPLPRPRGRSRWSSIARRAGKSALRRRRPS